MENKNIVISTRAILIFLTLIAAVWLVIQVKFILLSLLVAAIIALALKPAVASLQKRHLPKAIAILIVYAIFVSLIVFLLASGVPIVLTQANRLLLRFPLLLESILRLPGIEKYLESMISVLTDRVGDLSSVVVSLASGAVAGAWGLVIILFFSAYILADFDAFRGALLKLFPAGEKDRVENLLAEIEHQVGAWLRGEFILCMIVGLWTYFGLLLLKVEFAEPLAIIAGLLEILPNLGPTISMVPAAVVGFSQSPITGLGVVALFVLVQQLENQLIVPKVMQKVVGLNPLVTMIAILAGAKLFGVLGALIAIPLTLVLISIGRTWPVAKPS